MPLVIIIEDNEAIRENTTELLELEGFDVISANNGEDGLSAVLAHSPNLIISDVHMPGKNGYELLEILRKSDDTRAIPFVFLTSDSEKKEIETGLQSGAVAYLVKPFAPEDLYNVLRKYLSMPA